MLRAPGRARRWRVRPLLSRIDGPRTRRARRWAAHAFKDVEPARGDRRAMIKTLGRQVRWLERRVRSVPARDVAASFLGVCRAVEGASVGGRPRSYVDVSAQAEALRRVAEHLAPRASATALELVSAVVQQEPESRPALIAQGELLLAGGDVDEAIGAAKRALRVQAVCMTADDLLMRAYRAKRDAGSDDPELAIASYDLSERFCALPFTHLSTGWQGNAFACACPSWVPFSVGNVLEAETPEEVWNSDTAVEIRRSILDGDFSYCSRTQCSYMRAQKLPHTDDVTDPLLRRYIDEQVTAIPEPPRLLEVNHDQTCNLACPSCRNEIMGTTRAEQASFALAEERVLLPMMKRMEGQLYISGGGEALASRHCRSILGALNRDEFPGLGVYLISNGQLLTPARWRSLPTLPEMLDRVSISIDAACAETYRTVRRPGRWNVLMRNLAFVGELRRQGAIPELELNFVVQRANFREMLPFVELGEQIGADRLWFQRVVNYGSYDEATFAAIDVCSPLHPDHDELLEILRDPALRKPSINLDMLLGLLPEFVASDEQLAAQW